MFDPTKRIISEDKVSVAFYWEEGLDSWILWGPNLSPVDLLDTVEDGEEFVMRFKRRDMGELELSKLPQIS